MRILALLAGASLLGCTGSSQGAGADPEVVDPGDEFCIATMVIMQKDAYREAPGRKTVLWPAHTSTTLDVVCGGVRTKTASRNNHGANPDDVAEDGTLLLERVATLAAEGKRKDLEEMVSLYENCECGTKFVSMNDFADETVQRLIPEVAGYLTSNLSCSGSITPDALAGLLMQGLIDVVISELPNCSWQNGGSWDAALDTALQNIIADGETVQDYHVCNNDAQLQGKLLETFAHGGGLFPCDANDNICHGPLWFSEP